MGRAVKMCLKWMRENGDGGFERSKERSRELSIASSDGGTTTTTNLKPPSPMLDPHQRTNSESFPSPILDPHQRANSESFLSGEEPFSITGIHYPVTAYDFEGNFKGI